MRAYIIVTSYSACTSRYIIFYIELYIYACASFASHNVMTGEGQGPRGGRHRRIAM